MVVSGVIIAQNGWYLIGKVGNPNLKYLDSGKEKYGVTVS
jgi:hypothetical protein